MKIVLIAQEYPYPPTHGGRVDTWQRILALKELNVEIFLVSWLLEELSPMDLMNSNIAVEQKVVRNIFYRVKRNFFNWAKRVYNLSRYPSLIAARVLTKEEYSSLLKEVRVFNPDAIILDGLFGAETGLTLSTQLAKPVFIRQHNIEHQYLLTQFNEAPNLKLKIALWMALFKLKKYEYDVLHRVNAFFDISLDDLQFWNTQGIQNGYWVPPVFLDTISHKIDKETVIEELPYDVVFLGNLYTPNNLDGLFWFFNCVYPILINKAPSIRVLIMGSRPSHDFVKFCEQLKNVKLLSDVKDPKPYISSAKVLINPIRFGSGVNIKSIEMLFSDKYIVSCPQGVRGFPSEIYSVFKVTNDPELFAKYVLLGINNEYDIDTRKRQFLRDFFGIKSVEQMLKILETCK